MRNLYKDLRIPELFDDTLVQDFARQYITKDLSKMQIAIIEDKCNKEVELGIKLITLKKIKEYMYRYDYHGDPLLDHDIKYCKDFDETETIPNMCAVQHGVASEVPKYELIEKVQIIDKLPVEYITMFFEIYKKVQRNRFRKLTSKNRHIRLLNALYEQDFYFASKLYKKIHYNPYRK